MFTVPQALSLAMQQHRAGNLQQAEEFYRAILKVDRHQVHALHLLGLLAFQVGKLDLASEYIGQAVQLKPDYAEAHNNLGNVLHQAGKLPEAEVSLQEALRLKPDFAEAHNNLGNVLKAQEKIAEAVASYEQALRLKPDFAEALNNLGHLLQVQGHLEKAVASLQHALRLKPDYVEAHINLGNVLQQQGQLEEARKCFQQAMRLKSDYAPTLNNLGNLLSKQGKLEEAATILQQAVRLQPDDAEAHCNLGNVLGEQGKTAEALASYEEALLHRPDHVEAHCNRALAWLQQGDFAKGWPEYEWRWQHPHVARLAFEQPRWDGSPLDGRTILLHAEQGLGDTLQFIRYALLVKERGGRVLVACQPALLSLLRSCTGIDLLLPLDSTPPSFDVWAPLLSLPGLLQTTLTSVPANVPYLSAEPERVQHWQQQLSPVKGTRIGIIWKNQARPQEDCKRSFPLAQLEPLARLKNVCLLSLQQGADKNELAALPDCFALSHFGSQLEENSDPWMETAALLQNLDLVVACDSTVAHLAGALGVPVWVALPLVADWRWLRERGDSPWYPSMRLFRQPNKGHWSVVFHRMTAALPQWVKERSTGTTAGTPPGGEGVAPQARSGKVRGYADALASLWGKVRNREG